MKAAISKRSYVFNVELGLSLILFSSYNTQQALVFISTPNTHIGKVWHPISANVCPQRAEPCLEGCPHSAAGRCQARALDVLPCSPLCITAWRSVNSDFTETGPCWRDGSHWQCYHQRLQTSLWSACVHAWWQRWFLYILIIILSHSENTATFTVTPTTKASFLIDFTWVVPLL